ncbi:MAG: ECF transporter S component [Promethearchaeati archaeon SRVP18_Atabeyarchaeia-1]
MPRSDFIGGSSARFTAVTAIMTASVMVATIAFQLSIPATGGYFNFGESLVYISALLFGPLVGGFAGGIGSMLADAATGYLVFAPGTLVSKGVEGLVAGFLSERARLRKARKVGKKISLVVGSAIGLSLAALGITGVAIQPTWPPVAITLEPLIWVLVSILAGVLVGYVVYRSEVNGVIITLSMLAGGACMVIGYFLYELFLVGYIYAAAEIPFNIMQSLTGIVIAFPVSNRVRRAIMV